jgi:hypothetical protein
MTVIECHGLPFGVGTARLFSSAAMARADTRPNLEALANAIAVAQVEEGRLHARAASLPIVEGSTA